MVEFNVFDAAATPLGKGVTLVEASAGTGKTFAIAMLVLRAIAEQEIGIDQVLVVTFTVAATEELKERIRTRLRQGRDMLRPGAAEATTGSEHDPVLAEWAGNVRNPEQVAARLDLALLDIDRAGIHTIHGFCQRMLREQALESGQLFDIELIGDTGLLKEQLVQDFWRARLYPFDPRYFALVHAHYQTPEELHRSIAGAENMLVDLIPVSPGIETVCRRLETALTALSNWWSASGATLRQCLDEAADGGFLKQDLADRFAGRLDALEKRFAAKDLPEPEVIAWLLDTAVQHGLNGSRLRGEEKRRRFTAGWPLPGALLDAYLADVEQLVLAVRIELALALRDGLSQRLREQGSMSFDDLIAGLAGAISGKRGPELCQRISARYRLVLIDEFQDTDSGQWLIFSKLFGAGRHILFLIGDPKQAIYRFRGADIYSYFEAREAADACLTLARNFRSHPALMAAVNELFAGSEIAGLRYRPVAPAKRIEDGWLERGGEDISGLVYCQLDRHPGKDGRWSGGAAQQAIQCWIGAEIVELLNGCELLEACGPGAVGTWSRRALEPSDIAVLVRTNRQAEAYREQLSRCGVPAVVSSRKPVFATPECEQLALVLQAVGMPGDERLLKAAMSCDWFGLSGDEHYRITSDDRLMNSWHARFQDYYHHWLELGFLPMAGRLLRNEEVFLHLAAKNQAERRIANIQHLIELVQEAEQREQRGIDQTLLWLQKMSSGVVSADEMEMRLESDAEAVNIVTMHSAKGLEYPVVFCPYLISPVTDDTGARRVARYHDALGRLVCDLGSASFEDNRLQALEEEREEDLRLAYVAITRARLRSYLFWADVRERGPSPGAAGSSLGRLLFSDNPEGYANQQELLQKRAEHSGAWYRRLELKPDAVPGAGPEPAAAVVFEPRTKGARQLTTTRTRTSFSGLALLTHHDTEEPLSGAFDERSAAALSFQEISRLPGGVRFGNVVHEALENIDFGALASAEDRNAELTSISRRHGLDVDPSSLARLLLNSVTTGLAEPGEDSDHFTLAELAPEHVVKELHFTLSMQHTETGRLNEILGGDPACTRLDYRELEGYLTGYIDLVFRWQGRFYIADYKTNHLGDSPADYRRESMQSAMRRHNYGLQYWLYTLVVHRHLRNWLPDYDYRHHFGGVMYLFVRGMLPEAPGSGVYRELPDWRILERLDRCFGGAS